MPLVRYVASPSMRWRVPRPILSSKGKKTNSTKRNKIVHCPSSVVLSAFYLSRIKVYLWSELFTRYNEDKRMQNMTFPTARMQLFLWRHVNLFMMMRSWITWNLEHTLDNSYYLTRKWTSVRNTIVIMMESPLDWIHAMRRQTLSSLINISFS